MKKRIYIETTIPSFFHDTRPEPEMVARRNWTVTWWREHGCHYELVTSLAVLEELERGSHPNKSEKLALIKDLPFLPIESEVYKIVEKYISFKVAPASPRGDALHMALASYHDCNYLLTWNCAHIANPNKAEHIRYVNHKLGLFVPALVTPLEMLDMEDD